MSDDHGLSDAQIIQAAYAERVAEAFKVFAENLNTGQAEQACTVRFVRALELIRKTRDLALRAATHGAPASPGLEGAGLLEEAAPLSAEDQAMVDSALSGTTGRHTPPPPPPQRYRG